LKQEGEKRGGKGSFRAREKKEKLGSRREPNIILNSEKKQSNRETRKKGRSLAQKRKIQGASVSLSQPRPEERKNPGARKSTRKKSTHQKEKRPSMFLREKKTSSKKKVTSEKD